MAKSRARNLADLITGASDLAAGTIGTDEISADAVTAALIAAGAVGAAEIATGAVGTDKIANDAVTNTKVASGLSASKLTTGTLPSGRIADDSIVNAKLSTGIDASKLTTGTLSADRISSGAISNAKLASDIDASKLTTGTLPSARISNSSISNAQLASGIDASKLTTGTLPAARIASGAITVTKIADGAVTAAKIAAGAAVPTQTGQSGKYLTTDGTTASWGTITDPTPTAVSDQNNTSTGGFDIPSGSTAQRPSNPNTGYLRFNTSLGYVEQYTLGGWQVIAASPTISNVSPTSFSGESGTTITINGGNFDNNATAKFITSGGSTVSASVTTVVSASQITATTPRDFTVAEEPLTVQVVNGTGLAATLDDAIDCGSVPAWSTSSGSLGTTEHGASYNYSVTATDDGSIASYTVVSGSLPTNASLNSSTGAITGTCPASTGSATFSFTVRATDNSGNTNDRPFSISTSAPKYRYWRIQMNRGGGQIQTTEISLSSNGTHLGSYSSYTGHQAGSVSTIANGTASSSEHNNFASGSYIYFDYGSPGYSYGSGGVNQIRIGGSDDSSRYPSNIVVQYSTNNSSWTTVFNGSPPSFTHNGYALKGI